VKAMAAPNYARVSEGLKLFRDATLGFIVAELKRAHGELNWWADGIAKYFKKDDLDHLKELWEKRGEKLSVLPARAAELHEMLDINHFRNIIEGNWKDIFVHTLKDHKVVSWLQDVIDARNTWAHPPSGDIKAADANAVLHTCARIVDRFDKAACRQLEELRDAKTVESKPERLPHWWEIATPHRDFQKANFDESLFAADLGYVVQGVGAKEYVDPQVFFERTYPTRGIRELIKNTLERVRGRAGDPVVQVQTPFGGGKTHVLVSLYHLFNSPDEAQKVDWIRETLQELGLAKIPDARVIVIDAARLSTGPAEKEDGAAVNTIWGEMAWQVGGGPLLMKAMADSDSSRTAPGKDAIDQVLDAAAPAVLLFDEVLGYLTKAADVSLKTTTLAKQTIQFFQELSTAVANHPGVGMVFTLPVSPREASSAQMKQVRGALTQTMDEFREQELTAELEHRIRRVESVWQPLEGEEIFEVVRRRLFADLGDPAVHARVAEAYWQIYEKHRDTVASDAHDLDYKRLLEKSYPLHPELVKILYLKWSSLDGFQKTRGVLRFLGMVVADCWRQKLEAPLIHPSHVNLDNKRIRPEVVRLLRQGNFEPVIASDIAGPSAKAPGMDDTSEEVLGGVGPAVGTATAVFMHSFGGAGAERRGATEPELQLATLLPGLSPAVVGSVLPKLSKRLWFFHAEADYYRFDANPNLIRIIDAREEALWADREGQVDRLVEAALQQAVGRGIFRPYLWPKSHRDVDDSPALSLVVMHDAIVCAGGPEWEGKGQAVVEEWWKRHGNTPRKFQNALVFLLADETERENMRAAGRRHLACQAVKADVGTYKQLTDNQQQQLDEMIKEARDALPMSIASSYRHVAYPTKEALKLVDFGARAYTGPGVLQERVKGKLEEAGIEKLVSRVDPQLLATDKYGIWPDRDAPLNLKQLAEWFPQYPYLPMLSSEDALRETVAKGVRDGILALAYGEPPDFEAANVKYKRPSFSAMEVEVTESAWLLRPHIAEKYIAPEPPRPPEGGPEEEEEAATQGVRATATVAEAEPRYREVHIEIEGWENWNDLLRYVIRPLSDQGLAPRVRITIDADSVAGMPAKLLRDQIEVSLQQLGIRYTLDAKPQ
jgi:hypothetical protein